MMKVMKVKLSHLPLEVVLWASNRQNHEFEQKFGSAPIPFSQENASSYSQARNDEGENQNGHFLHSERADLTSTDS